jgi:hypothetical protein
MAYPVVLARAFRGEPLRRFLMDMTEWAAFVVNPDYLDAVEAGDSGAVGFPAEDVFEFDADLYNRLRKQWEAERKTDDALWQAARPYPARRVA